MRKLLWAIASVIFIVSACKTKKAKAKGCEQVADTASIWQAPAPASDNPQKYDSLKHELNKRRQKKKNK